MEIDTPGHTASIGLSHPEKMVCLYHTPYHGFCNEPPCGQLAMQDPSVSLWAQGVLADAVRLMSSKYFGTGGDEVKETCYVCRFNRAAAQNQSDRCVDQRYYRVTGISGLELDLYRCVKQLYSNHSPGSAGRRETPGRVGGDGELPWMS